MAQRRDALYLQVLTMLLWLPIPFLLSIARISQILIWDGRTGSNS